MLKRSFWLATVASIAMSSIATAKVSKEQAQELLDGKLTPFGAEKAGNEAGTIPPWTGGITEIPKGYVRAGQHHPDPFADDKPLFVITAANHDQYKNNLTEGQIELLKKYPDTYKMKVYQTRRSHSAPDWVYANTYINALNADLIESGNGIVDAYGGIPFPIARNGLEAVWNQVTRWRGSYINRKTSSAAVLRNGSFTPVTVQLEVDFQFFHPDGNFADLNNVLFYFMTHTTAPARLAGGAVLVHETLDQNKEPRQAWLYNAGQRRVRRAPNIAYDTPVSTSDGLMTVDEVDMFNGSPSRYNWKLVGKRELYIPYNNYALDSPDIKYSDLLLPGHIDPQYSRYELHRVYVLQADLKESARHIYQKRVLYMDEDSWSTVISDKYDANGKLWRVSLAYFKNFYEIRCTLPSLEVFYDLDAERYTVAGLNNEEDRLSDYSLPSPDDSRYKPAALRRLGRR